MAEAVLSKTEMRDLVKRRTEAKRLVEDLEDGFWPVAAIRLRRETERERAAKKKAAPGSGRGKRAVAAEEGAGQGALMELPVAAQAEAQVAYEPSEAGLTKARRELAERGGERVVVLDILRADLSTKLDGHVVRRRRALAEAYRVWEQKYGVSLREIERRREAAAEALEAFLKELRYVD
ncbi:hypothetical protein ACIBQ5_14590 [Streptomyces massasporeus]|uniref:hypothetical protein n=1 Tax=Streptomyces massasporeus TaxID=67324 RepID=UPI0037BBDAB9